MLYFAYTARIEPSKMAEVAPGATFEFIAHLPVLDAGDLVGLISIGDVVKAVIADQLALISQLEHYITH